MALFPLFLSLKIAGCAAVAAAVIGTLIAWQLSKRQFAGKAMLETLLMLPVVLPPTVVGYGLLLALGRGTALGRWINDTLGLQIVFTWQGAVIAGFVMGLPLMVRSAMASMSEIESEYLETARVMGANEWQIFTRIVLPMSASGIINGIVLAFARALGEFGATLMVAGNIPNETQTLPIAIYYEVQAGNDTAAAGYALMLAGMSFVFIWLAGMHARRRKQA